MTYPAERWAAQAEERRADLREVAAILRRIEQRQEEAIPTVMRGEWLERRYDELRERWNSVVAPDIRLCRANQQLGVYREALEAIQAVLDKQTPAAGTLAPIDPVRARIAHIVYEALP